MKKLIFLFSIIAAGMLSEVEAQFYQIKNDSIAVGDSASAGVDLGTQKFIAIISPDTLQQDTVAFWTSNDNVTWYKVYQDDGTELKVKLVAGEMAVLSNPRKYYGFLRYVKIQYWSALGDVDATGINDLFKHVIGYY